MNSKTSKVVFWICLAVLVIQVSLFGYSCIQGLDASKFAEEANVYASDSLEFAKAALADAVESFCRTVDSVDPRALTEQSIQIYLSKCVQK